MTHWPTRRVRLHVERLFLQTPGPHAGQPLGAAPAAGGAGGPAAGRGPGHAAVAVPGAAASPAPAGPRESPQVARPTELRLEDLTHCFQGITPALIATCSSAGEPNVTYLSQVYLAAPGHVALSRQFFNKTQQNLAENPYAAVHFYDPVTLEAYELELRYLRSEMTGPLFDTMAARIQVIASHTGMAGVFRLLSADVFAVLGLRRIAEYLQPRTGGEPPVPASPGRLGELRSLQVVSDRISRAACLEELLGGALGALAEALGFEHSMVLLLEEQRGRLIAIHGHGYGEGGAGAEVPLGAGVIGTAAERRRMVKVTGIGAELRYGRAVREQLAQGGASLLPEIPLPGLPDAQAQLALPLLCGGRLVGVLAFESRDPMAFDEWDEAFLQILANQIALGIDRMQDGYEDEGPGPGAVPAPPAASRRSRTFVFYRNDDCVFVDGEYLVRGVPGLILWKLLRQHRDDARGEFTNRELRLDPGLRLPPVKDNLESRLILLRKRLQEKCPDVALVPVARGRFALRVGCAYELVERASG
ncbi:MAG: GAF domain-containing protein [Planctomycetes bacterium]|nr:GAF domain-containing protein [Planctomycetota bacterium]